MSKNAAGESRATKVAKYLIIAIGLIAAGVYMIIRPDLIADSAGGEMTSRSRLFTKVLLLIWSVPGGIVAILLGLFISVKTLFWRGGTRSN